MKTCGRFRVGVLSVLVLVVGIGALLDRQAQTDRELTTSRSGNDQITRTPVAQNPRLHAREARAAEVQARFAQATAMLHAKHYEHAMAALHRVLELAPRMPEAHVNMGYALLGLGRYQPAQDFFVSALALRPGQTNAYFGLAVAKEGLSDLPGALGAMRTFVHLSPNDDAYLRRARAAIWEWEQARTRDPTGKAAARAP
jgi:tetratricopeptide (TPR) repeat protein